MLAHRIIPTFLVKGQILVKGKRFSGDRVIGHARQAIMIQAARGVDELAILDIAATREGRGPDLALIEQLTDGLFAPLSVGGGIRTVQDVRNVLAAGADKVIIGTAAMEDIYFLSEVTMRVGSQAIVAALDVKGGKVWKRSGAAPVTADDSIKTEDLQTIAVSLQDLGVGEILLTSIEREGTLAGYDLELVRKVSSWVTVPVIAHGGCSGYPDMRAAIDAGASAVAAGALFQYEDATPRGAAQYLARQGVEVRL